MNVFNRLKSNSNASQKPPNNALTEEHGPIVHKPKLTPPSQYTPTSHPPLDDDQKAKVKKLKEYIESIMLPETHEYYPNERGFITDNTIKRYMRARKWDYEVRGSEGNSAINFKHMLLTACQNDVGKHGSMET